MKKQITPISKDKPFSRNLSNQQRIFKDIKNIPTRQQTYSRNPSNSKLTITHTNFAQSNRGINP
jgi:hypothetical protein